MTHARPPQTSFTTPPACRKSDFCWRAMTALRGSPCGSKLVCGAVLVVGGVSAPLSYGMSADPLNG
jgi:hypothetical protein